MSLHKIHWTINEDNERPDLLPGPPDLLIEYRYYKGFAGSMYRPNGDPGDPPEPPMVEIQRVFLWENGKAEKALHIHHPEVYEAFINEALEDEILSNHEEE